MIGIIPAAGKAARMLGLPKMLLPIPGDTTLIDRLRTQMETNTSQILVGTNGVSMALLERRFDFTTRLYTAFTNTMSETVLLAREFTGTDQFAAFGMPDSYIEDRDAFAKLAGALELGADVAVGVFKTRPEQRGKLGMCRIDRNRIVEVVDKPWQTDLEWAWGVLAWKPVLWQYINATDPTIGDALPRAIQANLRVQAVRMDGAYYDCGTPDEYFKLIRDLTEEPHAAH